MHSKKYGLDFWLYTNELPQGTPAFTQAEIGLIQGLDVRCNEHVFFAKKAFRGSQVVQIPFETAENRAPRQKDPSGSTVAARNRPEPFKTAQTKLL